MSLAIIIPFYNGHETIGQVVDSIPPELPIIIVDDKSDEPLKLHKPNVRIFEIPEKGYFTGAVNYGIEQCDTDVLILNQDVVFTGQRWLNFIDEHRQTYGMIGEGIQGTHPAYPQGYIHGTFMFVRRDVIDQVGLMDADMYPLWGSTCEWQLRTCRQGFKALPTTIPDFQHRPHSRERFGSAIREVLQKEGKQSLFIKTPPEISVIIPCYNYGRYLYDAVHSLIGGETSLGTMPPQTMQSFEIVIVDDGSTDDSLDIAKSLVDPWQGIRLVCKYNGGTASALNAGINHSYGRYLTVLSADDMMEPFRLEELWTLAQQHPHSYVYDDPTTFAFGERIKRLNLGDYNYERIKNKNHVHAGILAPGQAFMDVDGYPQMMGHGREDWAINVALGYCNWHGVKSENSGYLYRREEQNRTVVNITTQHIARFREQIKKLYPNIYKNGENDMGGCCGGRKAAIQSKSSQQRYQVGGTAMSMPGAEGMELVEYIGKRDSDVTWFGLVTHHQYYAGGLTRQILVDQRDLPGFLKFSDFKNGPKVFRQITKAEAGMVTAVITEATEEAESSPAIVTHTETSSSLTYEEIVDILSTVKGLRSYLSKNDLSENDYQKLLEMEQNNKNRSSAISEIEKYYHA